MNETKSNLSKWIAAALVIGAFLLADFLTPQTLISSSEWPIFIMAGICIAQVNLTAIWAAMAPGNVATRLPWALMLSVFMWYALVLGNRFASPTFSLDSAMQLGTAVLFGVVVTQIPLWIASRVFRWRLVGWTDKREVVHERLQFQISHMMLGTVFVALAVSPAKMILPAGDIRDFHLDPDLFLALGIVATLNLLVTVPWIWIAFWRKRFLPVAAVAWPVYCGLLTGVVCVLYFAAVGMPVGDELYRTCLVMYVLNLTQCGVVLGTLLIFRAVGLRLVRLPRGGPARDEVKVVEELEEVEPG